MDKDVDGDSEDRSDPDDERNEAGDNKEDSASNSNEEDDIDTVDEQNDPSNMVFQMPTISEDDVVMLPDPILNENVGSYQQFLNGKDSCRSLSLGVRPDTRAGITYRTWILSRPLHCRFIPSWFNTMCQDQLWINRKIKMEKNCCDQG